MTTNSKPNPNLKTNHNSTPKSEDLNNRHSRFLDTCLSDVLLY